MEGQIFDIPEEHINQVLNYYSDTSEVAGICIEECSELIKAISKHCRSSRHPDLNITPQEARAQIVEETAHVAICLGMLKKIFSISEEEIEGEVYHKARMGCFNQSEYVYKTDMYIKASKVR